MNRKFTLDDTIFKNKLLNINIMHFMIGIKLHTFSRYGKSYEYLNIHVLKFVLILSTLIYTFIFFWKFLVFIRAENVE